MQGCDITGIKLQRALVILQALPQGILAAGECIRSAQIDEGCWQCFACDLQLAKRSAVIEMDNEKGIERV